eukprot:Polyplicarium_translucidae@DN1787_c0_g1_i2.p1
MRSHTRSIRWPHRNRRAFSSFGEEEAPAARMRPRFPSDAKFGWDIAQMTYKRMDDGTSPENGGPGRGEAARSAGAGARQGYAQKRGESFLSGVWNEKDQMLDEENRGRSTESKAIVRVEPDTSTAARRGHRHLHKYDQAEVLGIFSTRKPKDFGAGLISGLKSVGKGIGMGVGGLVGAPVIGAAQQGVPGFVKGLGSGIVMAVALPVTGLGVGAYQVTRGVANTPEAVKKTRAGKKWDKKSREWKDRWYALDEEAQYVRAMNIAIEAEKSEEAAHRGSPERAQHATGSGGKAVVDTTYYDVLTVAPDAEQSEIRKMYYKLARDCHPDRHPDDPFAKEQFQLLGEAYQVLGDEDRRREYDQHGMDVAQSMPIIDSSFFFMMLFGSEALEPYIGKLKMAMFVESGEDHAVSEEEMEDTVLKRILRGHHRICGMDLRKLRISVSRET